MFKRNKKPKIGIVRVEGTILASSSAKHVDLKKIKPVVDKLLAKNKLDAICVVINSPGGSPVQSELIASYIHSKAKESKIPLYSFIEDVGASGGYWIACCADEIYALSASIVGSIGVVSSGFGFEDFIKKHGIKRRVYTAGKSKSMLDPFAAEKESDIELVKELQGEIHEHFKTWVKSRRGKKIQLQEESIFNGRVWTGSQAIENGIIDGISSYVDFIRNKYGKNAKIIETERKRSFISSLIKGNFTENLVDSVFDKIQSESNKFKF